MDATTQLTITPGFVPVDDWKPEPNDIKINVPKGYFIIPFNNYFPGYFPNQADDKLNYFVLTPKKCYAGDKVRDHMFQYINYFCKYYDPDLEYISILFMIKIKIDRNETSVYPKEHFFADLEKYIVKGNILNKVQRMVEDNYCYQLRYVNFKNSNLQYTKYTDEHAKFLYTMSLLMILCIPALTQYFFMHKVQDVVDDYLLEFYDCILYMRKDLDIYQKLYSTAFTHTITNQRKNQGLWAKQDIRYTDEITHSTECIENLILNVMPKYTFRSVKNNPNKSNIINLNFSSIRSTTNYKITDIKYEYQFIPISSSKRDDDSVSDFDKFEADLIRSNEGLYLQNSINYQACMQTIDTVFGPFSSKELEHYAKRILVDSNGNFAISSFQKQLVFALFYKYFGDIQSIYAINKEDYVKLIIAAKKLLVSKGMIVLPYIISGKVERLIQRKSINKKEKMLVESSPSFPMILEKYKNESIINHILSIVATIISSDFSIVDMDPEIDGLYLDTVAVGAIIEEIEMFILMC